MENFNINTAQNVEISNKKAGVGNRLLASVLDLLFIGSYLLLVFVFLGIISAISNELNPIIIFIIYIPLMFYNLFFEAFFEGQTPGKKIIKIKVVRVDGGKPKFYHYLVRWIFRLVDIFMASGGIAVASIVLTEKAQRLGDLVAGTTVIKLSDKAKLNDTIYKSVEDEYKLQYENINLLSDKDLTIIKDVLDLVTKNPSNENIKLSYETKTQVEKVLDIHSDLNSVQFLKAIIKDYNHYNNIVSKVS